MDRSSKRLRDHEWQSYIQERRRQYNTSLQHYGTAPLPDLGSNAPDDLTGIALSGGGVRSATFGLGVLQALARHDLLRRFDYLSTVSGGGYIGSSLTWLTSKTVTEADDSAPLFPAEGFGLGPSREANGPLGVDYCNGDAVAPFPYGTNDPREERRDPTAPERKARCCGISASMAII